MTATFINAFCEPVGMLRRSLVIQLYPPVECLAFVQPAGVQSRVIWQLDRDTSHVPASHEIPRGCRLEIDMDPDCQSRMLT